MQKILFFGVGRIGLPTALMSSNKHNIVIGYDINKKLISELKKGIIRFNEKNIETLLRNKIKKKLILFSNKFIPSDVYIITVPTPIKKNNTSDLSYVYACIKKIISSLKKNDLIILESTLPIGTTNKIKNLIDNKKPLLKNNYFLSYCPERILPGKTISELSKNPRIIGGINNKSIILSKNFYKSFLNVDYYETDSKTAEMIKLSENSFRDVNIAFSNELFRIAKHNNIKIKDVISGANLHPRVNILTPGLGVGGHCIPVDPYFLIENYKDKFSIISNARKLNNKQPLFVYNLIISYLNSLNIKNYKNLNIGILGISYKSNTDDTRESPALEFLKILKEKKFKNIFFHDPFNRDISIKSIQYKKLNSIVSDSDCLIKLVNHIEYNKIKHNKKLFLSIDNYFE
jgi:UDP-N-acetyl-D-mannosaminuronic acid dehydrogenase